MSDAGTRGSREGGIVFERAHVKRYFDPEDVDERMAFATRVVTALKRVPQYATYEKLERALEKHRGKLRKDTLKSKSYWQHVYHGYEADLRVGALLDRLLDLIPVLLEDAAKEGIHLFADRETFENTRGPGSYFPPGFQLPIENSFGAWLDGGQRYENQRREAGRYDVEGLYDVFFPWLDAKGWSGRVAHGKARIYRHHGKLAFESYGNAFETRPVLYTGRLRFTGVHSAVLVGFTSAILGRELKEARAAACSEMLMHPYRLPEDATAWWHGATTFIANDTNDYTGTVGHVMKRRADIDPATAASTDAWRREIEGSTWLLESTNARFDEILEELRRCALKAV